MWPDHRRPPMPGGLGKVRVWLAALIRDLTYSGLKSVKADIVTSQLGGVFLLCSDRIHE
jgi:hypothetical protein